MFLRPKNKISPFEERFPLFFEIVPPEKGNRDERLQQHTDYLEKLFDQVKVDALNIPEIQDESKKGEKGKRRKPHKERIQPREYATLLGEHYDTEFVINRVCVKHQPDEHEDWLLETYNDYNISNIIFVGGESSGQDYPGPSVSESNRFVKRFLNRGRLRYTKGSIEPTDFNIGNISIPTRRRKDFDEPERMFHKQEAGADFFTTQIVYDKESPVSLLKDFSQLLEDEDHGAPTIFWSFSPISGKKDVDFLRWLGVYISEETEDYILDSDDPVETSIKYARDILQDMLDVNDQLPNPIPMGINISIMGLRNFDNGVKLAQELNALDIPK